MIIRKATLSDVEYIAEILVRSWQFAYKGIMPDDLLKELSVDSRVAGWKKHLSDGGEAWVIEHAGVILGVLEFGSLRDKLINFEEYGEIYVIYLKPREIGKGLGAKLMTHALLNLRAQGFQNVGIWVLEKNTRAIDFYKRFSFLFSGVSKQYPSTGLIEHLYHAST